MSMRARIVLRAAGSIPIDNKEREEALVNEEVEKIRRGKGKKVTTRQILEAFSNGDEVGDIHFFLAFHSMCSYFRCFIMPTTNVLIYSIYRASTSSE